MIEFLTGPIMLCEHWYFIQMNNVICVVKGQRTKSDVCQHPAIPFNRTGGGGGGRANGTDVASVLAQDHGTPLHTHNGRHEVAARCVCVWIATNHQLQTKQSHPSGQIKKYIWLEQINLVSSESETRACSENFRTFSSADIFTWNNSTQTAPAWMALTKWFLFLT